MIRSTLALLTISASTSWAVPYPGAEKMLADLPVTFERNLGQWPRNVEFAAHIGGHQYTFTGKEIIIDGAVHLDLVAFSRGKLEALDLVETKTNYLNSRDSSRWITGVPNYSRLRLRNAFPGIDMILYGSHGQLEFDYIVAPGASPDRIRFRVRGATLQSESGNLKLTTPSGEILDLRAPVAYQKTRASRRTIDCQFRISGRDEAAFTTAPFNHALPLLIDPVLTFLSVRGATQYSFIGNLMPVVTDADGYFYMGGTTYYYPIPATPGTLRSTTTCSPASFYCFDAWAMKFSPSDDRLVWATYVGVTSLTNAYTIALDPSGNVVLGGATGSPNFPTTPDAYISTLPPGVGGFTLAGFLAKLDPSGTSLVYSTFLEKIPRVMKLDSRGAAYFSDGPTIEKLSADGSTMVYSIQTPGGVNSIATDDAGNLYALNGPSPQFPVTPGAYKSSDNDPLFILKFDPQGNPLFAASLNASATTNYAFGPDIAIDPSGSIVFTGVAGNGFPVTNDPDPLPNDCDPNSPCTAYVAALDSTGSVLQYARLLGHGEGQKLAFGPSGDIWVAGMAYGGYFPRTFDAFHYCSDPLEPQGSYLNNRVVGLNGFVMRLDSQGQKSFSSFIGASFARFTDLDLDGKGVLRAGGFNGAYVENTFGGAGDARGYFAALIDTNQAPPIPHACLVNATQNVGDMGQFDQSPHVAPGQIVTLFGEGLGPQTPATAQWNSDGSLSTSLAGVQVLFDATLAPLLYAQDNQINCIVPFAAAASDTTNVVVKYAGNQTDPLAFHVANSIGNIFTKDYLPGADAIAINEDGTLNSKDHPATRGSIITLFATGLGQTDPPLADGQIAASAAPVKNEILVYFAGVPPTDYVPAQVLYQGAAPGQVAGVYQVNARIPSVAQTGHTYVQFFALSTVTEGIWLQ